MQRFGRKVVYVVIGDGVEEEQAAKKVKHPTSCPRPRDDPEVKYKKKKKKPRCVPPEWTSCLSLS